MFRKLLFILILFIVPLQLSWAGSVAFCLHKNNVVLDHAGHDAIGSDTASAEPIKLDRTMPDDAAAGHGDCGACHVGCLAVHVGKTHHFGQAAVQCHCSHYALSASSAPPQRLERPQWLHFA